MPSLYELQESFTEVIFNGDAKLDNLLAYCIDPTNQAYQGIATYRRSVLANLSAAVQATYPILGSIVGQDFLAAAARHYAALTPSNSGDLNAFGSDFDEFIANFEPAQTLPYLPDVAKLEWLIQQVYGAPDAPKQDLTLLSTTAPENWGELRFQLDPAHAFLESKWPIAHIWEVNQPDYMGDFNVDFNQSHLVLIHRSSEGIAVEILGLGEYALLESFKAGDLLDTAVQAATKFDEFDLQASLQRFISSNMIRKAY
ncbi:MAG: hypothetical protein CTY35_03025 [Methylotenera sp.]|jgi:hypothetical protein|nr:MAG: hypothetical protein CTY35_03025 [Methylotenera sp.]